MITGDILAFVAALGAREGDPEVQRLLEQAAQGYEAETFDIGGRKTTYLGAHHRGVSFAFEGGELRAVHFYVQPVGGFVTYPHLDSLVAGVHAGSTRAEIIAALGEPLRDKPLFLLYPVGDGFVNIGFDDNGDLKGVAAVAVDVLAGVPSSPSEPQVVWDPESVSSARVVGDFAVCIAAVGSAPFSPEHVALITVAGPLFDSFEEVDEQGRKVLFHSFTRTGVFAQFVDEVLVGVLVPLVDAEGPTFPDPQALVEGLELPASVETVREFFGIPRQYSQLMDLYKVEGVYVRVDFEGGVSSALSAVLPRD